MRLLGGILRPSRNQVTCGRGKLAMRGARMTAASPWDTLWCFSPSSKLPMSAEGRAHAGIRGGDQGLRLPGAWGGSGGSRGKNTGKMTPGQGDIRARPPLMNDPTDPAS